MDAPEVLERLAARGVVLAADGERLRFRPQQLVTPDLRAALVEHKAELLRAIEDDEREVAWRIAAMRPQVPPTGPIPTALARPEARCAPPGTCLHCGDPLRPDRWLACGWCVRAIETLLNEVREGLPGGTRRGE
jgi:hypothetical protein